MVAASSSRVANAWAFAKKVFRKKGYRNQGGSTAFEVGRTPGPSLPRFEPGGAANSWMEIANLGTCHEVVFPFFQNLQKTVQVTGFLTSNRLT